MIVPTICYKPVTRYTRAGRTGKTIVCPECDNKARVFHFSWSALSCLNCNLSVDKYDWLVESKG